MFTSSSIRITNHRDAAILASHNRSARQREQLPPEDKEQARQWNEFSFGMNCLAKYMHQSRLNYFDIVKSNVQLLHSNLKRNALYRAQLSTVRDARDTRNTALMTSRPLFENSAIRAEFMRIEPTTQSVALTDCCTTGEPANDCASTHILLIIMGKLTAVSAIKGPLGVLKTHDVLIQDGALSQSDLSLTTNKKAVMLSIQLTASQQ